jgi:hypothetical protein
MSDEKNPVEAYLTEKTASLFGGIGRSIGANVGAFGGGAGQALATHFNPGTMGQNAVKGIIGAGTAALGAGAVAGGIYGANHLYNAATKAHDFRQMLAADQQLAALHAENPRLVNQMFSTLRTFNPSFTRDPVVASQYVRHMSEDPATAGGVAVEALQSRDKMKNPLIDHVSRAMFAGGKPKGQP